MPKKSREVFFIDALGIIVEYNPFHNGHLYHLLEAKKTTGCNHTVAVMSGHFVQRGEPAVCDKWRRTRMALLHGVDLVIELPVYYASAGSDYFARSAVKLLQACGIVGSLCFGSECGDIRPIREAGGILAGEPPLFKNRLRNNLQAGMSFAAARAGALAACIHDVDERLLSLPNNGLGIEYCKALCLLAPHITPYTVRRADHLNDVNGTAAGGGSGVAAGDERGMANGGCGVPAGDERGAAKRYLSAREIRGAVLRGDMNSAAIAMPSAAFGILSDAVCKGETVWLDEYSRVLQYILRTRSADEIRAALDMTEGLENRFRHFCGSCVLISELLSAVKTKRYTRTKLQRAALHLLLNISAAELAAFDVTGGPPYIRVLGFRKENAFLLREMKKNATLPIVMNLKHAADILPASAFRMLRKEIEATDIYTTAYKKSIHGINHEYTIPLVIV